MISTDERNKLVISAKADIINKKHRGHILINTDPNEYQGAVVTIPAVRGCAAFSFSHSVLDDTPGKPVTIARQEILGGGVRGYSDLDETLQGKNKNNKQKKVNKTKAEAVSERIEKIIDSSDEQALDEFFSNLVG
jgi:hypothetical protein